MTQLHLQNSKILTFEVEDLHSDPVELKDWRVEITSGRAIHAGGQQKTRARGCTFERK